MGASGHLLSCYSIEKLSVLIPSYVAGSEIAFCETTVGLPDQHHPKWCAKSQAPGTGKSRPNMRATDEDTGSCICWQLLGCKLSCISKEAPKMSHADFA